MTEDSGDRKIKELNLMTEDWLCVMQKLGGTKALSSRISKLLEKCN